MRPDQASARWAGVLDSDEAGPRAILAYLGAYGPATTENFRSFVARGTLSVRQLRRWFAAARDHLLEVDVDGDRALIRAEDADELATTSPSREVRLLPGFDQFVMGPGTDDGHVVPAQRRAAVSRQSGWITPVVLRGGVIHGTWELDAERISIAWFREAGSPPRDALADEVARLASILDRSLEAEIHRT